MKILFVIAHYYNAEGNGKYGSTRSNPAPRINALSSCITSLHQLFGAEQFFLDISKLSAHHVNDFQRNDIDVAVLTTQGRHLLQSLNISPALYTNRETNAEPMMLGFEAKRFFAENFGKYDYFCYLEDDLIINDAWFFAKLEWFRGLTSDNYLLLPNRYEVSASEKLNKVYIDGNIRIQATEKFQNVNDSQSLTGEVLNEKVSFKRVLNPHSGCYFLNSNQLKKWMEQSYFEENDTSFIGPLESAATLGAMKTFKIYKPDTPNFLEIMHYGVSYLGLIGSKIQIAGN